MRGVFHLAVRFRPARRAVLRERSTYAVDRIVLDISPLAGIAISVALLVVGSLVYHAIAAPRGTRSAAGGGTECSHAASAFGVSHMFSALVSYIQVGAMIGTCLTPSARQLPRSSSA